jgi:hypothetical protein
MVDRREILIYTITRVSVADPDTADPDLTYHFDAHPDADPDFFMRIRIRLFILIRIRILASK